MKYISANGKRVEISETLFDFLDGLELIADSGGDFVMFKPSFSEGLNATKVSELLIIHEQHMTERFEAELFVLRNPV